MLRERYKNSDSAGKAKIKSVYKAFKYVLTTGNVEELATAAFSQPALAEFLHSIPYVGVGVSTDGVAMETKQTF